MLSALRSRAAALASTATRVPAQTQKVRRLGGGGGHGHADYTAESAPRPPFSLRGREREGWELPLFICVYGGLAMGAVGYMFRPDTRLKKWAKDEAKERVNRRANGEEVEPGYNYAQLKRKEQMLGQLKKE